jgi:uncharacterized protein YjbI with pentapeptide repeats
MANPEHVKLLKQGVEVWNKERKYESSLFHAYHGLFYDLSEVDLSNQDLSGYNFDRVNLCSANLSGSNLTMASFVDAYLHGANFSGADLKGADFRIARLSGGMENLYLNAPDRRLAYIPANLESANLWQVNFGHAYLSGVKLTKAHLTLTIFADTYLDNADFTQAKLNQVTFVSSDLSSVNGLDNVHHESRCFLDINTIYQSRGNIPEKFLRGCGIPESFIVQIPALVAAIQPIQFYSCFISYSSKDEEFAKRLYADLQNEGVRCWFAPEDLKIGERFRVRIDESIRLYDKLLLVLSENSVSSQWVEKEVETAFEKEEEQKNIVLFPVRLDDAVLETKTGWAADVRRSRHVGDFREWKNHDSYRKAFDRLMRDLKAEARR